MPKTWRYAFFCCLKRAVGELRSLPALLPQYQASHPLQAAVLRCWPIRVLPTRPRAGPSTRSRLTDAASEVQAWLPALLCRVQGTGGFEEHPLPMFLVNVFFSCSVVISEDTLLTQFWGEEMGTYFVL